MVCTGFKQPDMIDPKFFDPAFVFEDITGAKAQGDQQVESAQQITSLKKLLDKKKVNRSGYSDAAGEKNVIFEECDLIDFLEAEDPYVFLTKFNKFNIDLKTTQLIKDHPKDMRPPSDLDTICEDLKVCGKRELYNLLKLRHKFQVIAKGKAKDARDVERKAYRAANPRPEEDEDAKLDRQLEETIARIEKDKKKAEKKERVLAAKADLRQKMSVIATNVEVDNDEDIYLNKNQWSELRKVVVKGDSELSQDEDEDDDKELESIEEKESEEEGDSDDEKLEKDSDASSVDSNAVRVDEMAQEFEDQIAQ